MVEEKKYPVKNTYLPHDFELKPSNNSRLRNKNIFNSQILIPSSKYIGINPPSIKTSTNIKFGEIYVLNAEGTNLFKIGCTSNFNKRFKDLASASPLPINVWKYGRCDNPHLLEGHLHKIFVKRYFKNEWFALTGNDIEIINVIFKKYFHAD
jgi:hypothetical protein